MSENVQSNYMGMSVWRPNNAFPVGRTILAKDLIRPPGGSNWQPFLTCSADEIVHVGSTQLRANGAPFIQQDHMVAACASAAIWMSQWYMATRFDEFTKYYSPQITEAATRYDLSFGRAIPSEGLHNGQILEAFRALGYDPIAYDLLDKDAIVARRLLYRLVESEIPVVAGLYEQNGGHAITLFGHVIDPNAQPNVIRFPEGARSRRGLQYIDSSDYSVAFIASDDAAGPYRWMELINTADITQGMLSAIYGGGTQLRQAREFLEKLHRERVTTAAIFMNPNGQPDLMAGVDFLAAPLPTAVTLPPKEAQDKALAAFQFIVGTAKLPSISVRTYLAESSTYKDHVSRVTNPMSNFSWWMRTSQLPKWVWVTEFSRSGPAQPPMSRRVVASVLIDSSAPRDTLDFVLMHVAGWVIAPDVDEPDVTRLVRDIADGRKRTLIDRTFQPYSQLTR